MLFQTYKGAVLALLAWSAVSGLGWVLCDVTSTRADNKQEKVDAAQVQQERHDAVDAERYVIGGTIKEYSFPENNSIAIHFTDGRSIRLAISGFLGFLGNSSEIKIPLYSPCVVLYNGHQSYISTTEVTVNERVIMCMRLGITPEDFISTEALNLVMPTSQKRNRP